MRDRKADRCPRCGGKFVPDPYSDRTVPGGTWYVVRCRNCGHVHVGPEAPDECPVCAHPKAYFELQAKNY